MACYRGRGTLEVKESTNPFFQPASRDVGLGAKSIAYDAPKIYRPMKEARIEDDFNFSFLYSRVNDDIGSTIPKSNSKLGEVMGKSLSKTELARLRAGLDPSEKQNIGQRQVIDPTSKAKAILKHYKHQPRNEHIMYQTANNTYGQQPPTVATLTAERKARIQQFSNSFNGIKYRDQSLNTSMTKSKIHDGLDLY